MNMVPQHLSYNEGRIEAYARPMQIRRKAGNHVSFSPRRLIDLETDIDVVWMRQDPPFDMAYITAAHLLERLKGKTLVVNDPEWVRSCPEKILPLDYPDLMPETLITRHQPAIDAFREKHKDIIFKTAVWQWRGGCVSGQRGRRQLLIIARDVF